VDPDNRLVATVLEAEWNTKLRELEEARAIEERHNQSDQPDREHGGTRRERRNPRTLSPILD
jgi:hypothetical protein